MAERGENQDMTNTDGGGSRGTPVRRSTRLNSTSTPAVQVDGASTPKSKVKPIAPSSENTVAVRRSLRLSVSKSSPEDKLLKKVVTRRASTNAISTPRRQSQDTREGEDANTLRLHSRRCVSESPTKKDEITEPDVIPARRSTRLSTGGPSTPSKQLWSSKSRQNLAAVSEDPSESNGTTLAYEKVVGLTRPKKQQSNVDHMEGSPSRADQKNEHLQEVRTHTSKQLQVNADNSKDLRGNVELNTNFEKTETFGQSSFTKRSAEALEESTPKELQIIHKTEDRCDTQSEDVVLARNPSSNRRALTSDHATSIASPSLEKVGIENSTEDITMSANKSHFTEQSGDSCVVSSNLIPSVDVDGNNECYLSINTDQDVSVSNGSREIADHTDSQTKSQWSSGILPKTEKENDDMIQAGKAVAADGNKHFVAEVCNGLDSCEIYSNQSVTDDPAPDDLHLEIKGSDNSDDDSADIRIQHSTTLTTIKSEVLNVSKQKPEENDIQHEHNSTTEYTQVTQDTNADDEKENDSLCTNKDHIPTGEETSANSFSNKTPSQNSDKMSQRLNNSLPKRNSVESLTDKELAKHITPTSTTPNKNGIVMHATVPNDTLSEFESQNAYTLRHNICNTDIEKVQSSECKNITLNGHLRDENQPANNGVDNLTSEDKPSKKQQDQGNITSDDEDDIFSEGSLSFESDAIRTSTINELLKTKNCQSEVSDENVTTVGPISQPSPLQVHNSSPEPPYHDVSHHIVSDSPKVAKDNLGSNSVNGQCENGESSYLKHASTPEVKKRKHQHVNGQCENGESSFLKHTSTPEVKKRKHQQTPLSPPHSERNILKVSAKGSLQNIPLSIKSSPKIKSTLQEEIELATLEDDVETCMKKTKKRSLDTTKVTLMECTKVRTPEDKHFSKKKRLTDFDSPFIDPSSKGKKTGDPLTSEVSLKETVVAMMQLTDNLKPGRKIPEMSKEAEERIDQHIAEYLNKQENEKHKKKDDSSNSSLEDCDNSKKESNRSSQRMMEFLDDMADEGEESSVSDDSNAIPDDGESVGYSSNDNNPDDSYEQDSFIDDEEYELISGSEYASDSEQKTQLEACEEVEAVPSDKRWTRIVTIDSSSEEDDNIAVNASKNSFKVNVSSSVENEHSPVKTKGHFVYKTHLNQTNHSVEQQGSDASLVATPTKSTNTSVVVQENITQTPYQMDQSTKQQVSAGEDSPVFISPKPRKTSITIQENISVKDIKDESLRETISDVVDMFCKRSMSQGEVTLNVSLNYTPGSPGTTHSRENFNRRTTTTSGEMISHQGNSACSNKKRRRNRKRKPKSLNMKDTCSQRTPGNVSSDFGDNASDKMSERQVNRKKKEILRKQVDSDSKVSIYSPVKNWGKEYCKQNVKLKSEPIAEHLPLSNQKQRKTSRDTKKIFVKNLASNSSEQICQDSKETDKFDHLIAKENKKKSKMMFVPNENYNITEPKRKRRKISASTSNSDPTWTTEVADMKPSGSSNQQISHSNSELAVGQIAFHPKDFRSKMLYNGKRVQRVKTSSILKRK